MENRSKFRIFDKKINKYITSDKTGIFERDYFINSNGEIYKGSEKEFPDNTYDDPEYDFQYFWELEEIENNNNRYVIEWCTGRKDKNKKFIYASDILLDPNNEEYVVIWNENLARFQYVGKHGDKLDFPRFIDTEKSYKIIGNINENPELLNKE